MDGARRERPRTTAPCSAASFKCNCMAEPFRCDKRKVIVVVQLHEVPRGHVSTRLTIQWVRRLAFYAPGSSPDKSFEVTKLDRPRVQRYCLECGIEKKESSCKTKKNNQPRHLEIKERFSLRSNYNSCLSQLFYIQRFELEESLQIGKSI